MKNTALARAYDPKDIEKTWYGFWREKGYFRPEFRADGQAFTVVIPPPNVTGELHMGHALQHAIHDAMIRYKRMQGFRTLCLPGTDHAGIGTQMKVEQAIWETKKKTRRELGREALLERIWAWREKYGSTILAAVARLGMQLRLVARAIYHGRGLCARRVGNLCGGFTSGAGSIAASAW